MITIEFHSNNFENVDEGTLVGVVGGRGKIQYATQAERLVREEFRAPSPIARAYAIDDNGVCAVWGRSVAKQTMGKIFCIARSPDWDGDWELPFAYPDTKNVVCAVIGHDIISLGEGEKWAAKKLQKYNACALVLDDEGILAAWEKSDRGPLLVAKGPPVFSVTIASGRAEN